jgi:hypothetical protein
MLSLHKSQKLFLNPLGVYVAQIYTTSVELKSLKLSRREQLILLEIGKDKIDTASSFVDYMHENYGFSKSSTWYCLNKLKELRIAEFANKAEQGKPLSLTKLGVVELGRLEGSRNEIVTRFSNTFMSSMENSSYDRQFDNGHLRNRYFASQ